MARKFAGRDELPTYGIIDSQSVETIYSGEARGIDGGKKIKGSKRHIIVDIMGFALSVVVHAANLHDTVSGLMPLCVAKDVVPTIIACCADSGYKGTFESDAVEKLGVEVDIIERPKGKKWEILPKRWRVERTFAWLGNLHRLSKDYEKTVASAVAFIYLANIRILLKRLRKSL